MGKACQQLHRMLGGSDSSMAEGTCWQADVRPVTKSFPSPGLSFLQPPPNGQLKNNYQSASKHLKDIHMVRDQTEGSYSFVTEDGTCANATLSTSLYNKCFVMKCHQPGSLMEDFFNAARGNTEKNLETCGVLGAFLKDGTFYVTTLIIPKQEATSSSAINEEEIYAIQSGESLLPIGWIHTHPSQSCFMSSIDLHTQYTYQVMVPEAVGIVLAPTDESRKYGIFRLCDTEGMHIIKECEERGFHLHKQAADETPIYEDCSNIIFNPNLRLEIHDLR